MPDIQFTEKQNQLMRVFKSGKLKRINLLEGSVRSGKTWISLVLWSMWVATRPKEYMYMMCAKSLQTLKRNCLLPLQELIGENSFTFSISTKEGRLFGRRIMLEGANDARSENKIRGITLAGAYCDELTLFPEDFWNMLLSRLSVDGAKLFATTNPDHPKHWLKAKVIDNPKIDLFDMFFSIDDNTTLPAEYITNLKKEYVGVFYDRFITGLWVVAEGAIYRYFAENKSRMAIDKTMLPHSMRITIGCDFGGNKSAHTFVATAVDDSFNNIFALCSERHDAKDVSPDGLNVRFRKFIERVQRDFGAVTAVYADCAEQTLINGFKLIARPYGIPVHNSIKNAVNDRIRLTLALMNSGRFFYIPTECQTLENALEGAVWDDKSFDDKRLDNGTSDIDTMDAFEYSFEKYSKQLLRSMGGV